MRTSDRRYAWNDSSRSKVGGCNYIQSRSNCSLQASDVACRWTTDRSPISIAFGYSETALRQSGTAWNTAAQPQSEALVFSEAECYDGRLVCAPDPIEFKHFLIRDSSTSRLGDDTRSPGRLAYGPGNPVSWLMERSGRVTMLACHSKQKSIQPEL